MDQIPKHINRALRQLSDQAYAIELGRQLQALEGDFGRWHRGEITAFDVSEAIHRFHQGPARDLFVRYTRGFSKDVVAQAIHSGILDRTMIAPEVLEELAPALNMYAALDEAG